MAGGARYDRRGMRAFSVQECSPFDGALPAACTPACRPVPAGCAGGQPAPERASTAPAPERAAGRKGTVADGPLIVQSDKTLLLEVDHPAAPEATMTRKAKASKPVTRAPPRGGSDAGL